MDYVDQLRRLAIHADEPAPESLAVAAAEGLAPRELAIGRFSALIAMGGTDASFSAAVDEAVRAQVSARELVHAILGVAAVVGMPRAVSAAQHLAVVLGLDDDTVVPGSE
ncbi:hypothetical protein ABIQ69_08900 [Agromyces sp. G08B096]|uniref:Carboxymuconolactone decarboxylase family protein n=1 Tax=Agromyces sp. G08B096 TaxID=3156399 RepID=A0AAU7W2S3_9MICO